MLQVHVKPGTPLVVLQVAYALQGELLQALVTCGMHWLELDEPVCVVCVLGGQALQEA